MKKLVSILAIGVAVALTPVIAAATECPGKELHAKNPDLRTANTAIDPVCGMEVKTVGAKYVYTYKGRKYYFCEKKNLEKFRKDPGKYIK